MKISVRVKTGKHVAHVEQVDASHFVVHVTARPERGRANAAVLDALAQYLEVAPSRLRIISGHTAQTKIIEVE